MKTLIFISLLMALTISAAPQYIRFRQGKDLQIKSEVNSRENQRHFGHPLSYSSRPQEYNPASNRDNRFGPEQVKPVMSASRVGQRGDTYFASQKQVKLEGGQRQLWKNDKDRSSSTTTPRYPVDPVESVDRVVAPDVTKYSDHRRPEGSQNDSTTPDYSIESVDADAPNLVSEATVIDEDSTFPILFRGPTVTKIFNNPTLSFEALARIVNLPGHKH